MNICNKIGYNTAAAARLDIKVIDAQASHFNKRGYIAKHNRRKHVYRCDKCGMYHLTTVPKIVSKRLKKRVVA